MKILIVEDEQRAREGLRNRITALGEGVESVSLAANGKIALELIRKNMPDVVFADVKMPVMDGLTLARKIREMNLPIEIVIVSAYADFEFARESIELDVCEYILKPVTQADLEKTMKRLAKHLNSRREERNVEDNSLRSRFPNAHPLVGKALDLIEAGYGDKINQKELSAELGISPEYFSYLFSRNTGKNFSVFLRDYRISQAKRLYGEALCDKRDIPYMVGFSDEKYFAQVFKKVTGMTPSEYMRSNGSSLNS